MPFPFFKKPKSRKNAFFKVGGENDNPFEVIYEQEYLLQNMVKGALYEASQISTKFDVGGDPALGMADRLDSVWACFPHAKAWMQTTYSGKKIITSLERKRMTS